MNMFRKAVILGVFLGVGFSAVPDPGFAAEQIVFVSGAFRRSIPVDDLELLATTGEARGLLADVLRLGRQDPQEVADTLNQEVSLPLILTSRLLHTRIGEALLTRVANVIYPLKAQSMGVPALRAATINGLHEGDGRLSPVRFLRAYPNQELAVNLPAAQETLTKVKSVADLIREFLQIDLGTKVSLSP
jgi:hypothetical protein